MSGITFLKNFIKKPIHTGAVWPSSPYLSIEMTKHIGIEKASAVVEIGPGTGAVTPHIINRLSGGAKFFAIELNGELCECLRKKHPNVKVYHDDAANLKELLKKEEIDKVDIVFSGIPWAWLPSKIQDSLLNVVIHSLRPGGHFVTFAYLQGTVLPSGLRFKSLLKKHFSVVGRSRTEWRNIPPAFVYRCRK